MAILVIKSDESKDMLFDKISTCITNGIADANKEIEYFNLNSLDIKKCLREFCSERDFDKHAPYGCRKYKACIESHNSDICAPIYTKLAAAEAVVICVREGSLDRDLQSLIRNLEEKEHNYWERNKKPTEGFILYSGGVLENKKVLLIVSPGEYERSYRLTDRIAEYSYTFSRSLRMHVVDTFIVDSNNEKYMLPVISFAVNMFSSTYKELEMDTRRWYEKHYGK